MQATITHLLKKETPTRSDIKTILEIAQRCEGLSLDEVAQLLVAPPEMDAPLFATAREVKERLYGKRIVLFAPLYISNYCTNNCRYCAFKRENTALVRHRLSTEQIREQTEHLIRMGHKRVLLEAGEDLSMVPMEQVVEAIKTIYAAKVGHNQIRRVNVNVAATDVDDYRQLKAALIGTYQLFQETYHRPTYEYMHPDGPKSDYFYHLTAMERALAAGIDDFGIGVLFGLYDYRYELLALIAHADYLRTHYGVGPHTVSVPRIQSAQGTAFHPPAPVNDDEFKRLVAILRLALPYTGLILSTRERPEIRDFLLDVGISQMSAASSTVPGGYGQNQTSDKQFHTHDDRSLDECVADIVRHGYVPSFCTGCYRQNRTGSTFMAMVEAGQIRDLCHPNAVLTLAEYLEDYANPETRAIAQEIWPELINAIEHPEIRDATRDGVERIKAGERDVYL